MSDRERFSSAEKQAAYLASGGRCTRCGKELPKGWHADHRQSRKDMGPTDVTNINALCPACNLEKGASSESGLRLWQGRALDKYTGAAGSDFLLVATPGAGKTRFAGEVLRNHLRGGAVTRMIIVVPTERLKIQWARDLHELGINIEPRWDNATGVWPEDMAGVSVTYAQVASNPMLFRKHVSDRRTFAVLDEIHHCGDQKGWGEAVKYAFVPGAKRLGLSGTPFRSDNNAIPFVRYVDGKGVADFEYGYADALADGIVRSVYFPRIGGMTEWSRVEGITESRSFDDDLGEQGRADRLRTALTTKGWLRQALRDANPKLMELRQTDVDAAGIIWAIDDSHARGFVAPLLRETTGITPVVVTSHDRDADSLLDAFVTSRDPWIVSIRMVAEGIDIPRLRVGVYATTTTTELFFRQAVGRVVRVDEDGDDAHFFIPDDPGLREWAAKIKDEREHVLEEEIISDRLWPLIGEQPLSTFVALGSSGEDKGVIFDGESFDPDHLDWVNRVRLRDPMTAGIEPARLAKFLQNADLIPKPASSPVPAALDVPAFERKKRLRKAITKMVSSFAYQEGVQFDHVNANLNRAVGCEKRDAASEEQLEKMLSLIQKWRADGSMPS